MLALDFTFGKRSLDRSSSTPPSSPFGQGQAQDSIASDRLQKAIERNRAKQAKRENRTPTHRPVHSAPSHMPPPPPRPTQRPAMGSGMNAQRPAPGFRSRFNRGESNPTRGSTGFSNRSMHSNTMGQSRFASSRPASAPMPHAENRKSYMNSSVIHDKIREKLNAPINRIKETTNETINKTKGFLDAWSLRIGWLFCLFLLVRLIVSDGGLIDFYSKKIEFDNRVSYKQSLQKENLDLIKEIDQIKNNSTIQKELVRKHLGYISSEEYLVLFSKESK